MKTKFKRYTVTLLTLVMTMATLPEEALADCSSSLVNSCKAAIAGVQAGVAAGMAEANSLGGGLPGVSQQGATMNGGAAGMSSAASTCQSNASKCQSVCASQGSAAVQNCQSTLNNLASSAGAQGAGYGANGMGTQSTGDSMGGILSALAPLAGLAAMMAQQQQDQPQQPDTSHALQPNGSLDCSKPDAFYYEDCNSQLISLCNSNMTDYRCVDFYSRYCAGGSGVSGQPSIPAPATLPLPSPSNPIAGTPSAPPVVTPGGGGVAGGTSPSPAPYTGPGIQIASTTGTASSYQYVPPAQGAAGEGVGTSFCSTVSAYNFCSQGGHDQCPSCLQLQQLASANCQQNPAACLGTNSANSMAGSQASCPSDPLYTDSNVAAGWGFQAPSSGAPITAPTFPVTTPTPSGAPLPVAVLPQSVKSGGAAAIAGAKVASAAGTAAKGMVGREGAARGTNSLANYANGSNPAAAYAVGAANMISAQSVSGGVARDVASGAGGNLLGNATRTASAGPAPDVQGQYGPSVFAMGSQAIRSLCKARKFANCP